MAYTKTLEKTHEGAKGLDITLDITYTLSGTETLFIKYRKPNGATGRWVATQKTVTSISYLTFATDLDVTGIWEVQAFVETANLRLFGEIARFEVMPHIPDSNDAVDVGEAGDVVID